MDRTRWFPGLFSLLLVVGLAAGCNDNDGGDCTLDALECADGTTVGRQGPDCSFDCSEHGGFAGDSRFSQTRTYVHEPDGCSGPPENPTCRTSLTFTPEGRVSRVDGDIVEDGVYVITGNTVTASFADSETAFQLSDDRTTLTSGDVVFTLSSS